MASLLTGAVVAVAAAGCSADTGNPSLDSSPPAVTPTGSGGTAWPTTGSTGGAAQRPSPLGAKWDWGRYTEFSPFLTSVSGGSTYYEVVWCDIEKKQGHRDWSALDRVATRSREVGATLLLKLRVGRCWATSGDATHQRGSKNKTESAMPNDLGAYRSWVREAVTRYAAFGVREYAIENEINSKSFWAGTPEQFTTLAKAASAEIRAADPRAKVVDAGLSSTTYGYGIADWLLRQGRDDEAIAAFNAYYERRFGTRGDQIVAAHSVADLHGALSSEQGARNLAYLEVMRRLAVDKVTDIRQIHFYEKYSSVPQLFAFLRATTPRGTPIQAWEVGRFDKSDGGDEVTTSDEVLKTMALVLAEGATVAIWLPLAFDPGGRNGDEPRSGLLDPDGTVRPAGRLFQAMVEASRGATVVKVSGSGLTGVAFDTDDSSTAFVWSDHRTTVQLPDGAKAASVRTLDTPSAHPTVTVDSIPQRVELPVSAATWLKEQR